MATLESNESNGFCWKNSVESVASGSLAASIVACAYTKEKTETTPVSSAFDLLLDRESPLWGDLSHYEEVSGSHAGVRTVLGSDNGRGRVTFNIAPVLVCRRPGATAGLGDAVSSAGLLRTQRTMCGEVWRRQSLEREKDDL